MFNTISTQKHNTPQKNIESYEIDTRHNVLSLRDVTFQIILNSSTFLMLPVEHQIITPISLEPKILGNLLLNISPIPKDALLRQQNINL